MPGSRKFTQWPLLQAQSSVWNRLSFLNNFLMFLHKLNEIFRANWMWISDCLASSILKTVPVSRESDPQCKFGEFFAYNNTKPLFRIAGHFWTKSHEIPKQISYVLRGIKGAILRKLVKISDWQVPSFLKTVPGCRVSRHLIFWIWKLKF